MKPKKPTKTDCLKAIKNFAVVEISYSLKIVLPYDKAIALMETLSQAEVLDRSDVSSYSSDDLVIKPMAINDSPTFKVLSEKEYINYKMSHLLGTKVEAA